MPIFSGKSRSNRFTTILQPSARKALLIRKAVQITYIVARNVSALISPKSICPKSQLYRPVLDRKNSDEPSVFGKSLISFGGSRQAVREQSFPEIKVFSRLKQKAENYTYCPQILTQLNGTP